MKKKLLGVLFVLGLLLALPSVVSFAAVKDQGNCGLVGNEKSIKWVLGDDGTFTISGEGEMKDYFTYDVPWSDYFDEIKTVVIEKDIIHIGENAFKGCNNNLEIYYTGTANEWEKVTKEEAFNDNKITLHYVGGPCGGTMRWAVVNGTLTISGTGKIEDYTGQNKVPWFDYLTDINTVIVRKGVTDIGENAFSNCTNLTLVDISSSVTNINSNAFNGCTNLTAVYYAGVSEEWKNVNKNEGNDNLSDVKLHYKAGICGVDRNEGGARSVKWELNDRGTCTISGVGDMAKYGYDETPWNSYSKEIKTGVIKEGITNVGDFTFYQCSNLTLATLPESVTSIGFSAFCGCSISSINVPKGVTSLDNYAFADCKKLTSITIPHNVNSIGYSVFNNCTRLTTIYIPNALNVSQTGIPETATKLYYTAEEGNITPVTIDKVDYGTGKDSITLMCGIMGNGYVIQSAEDTSVTIEHKYEIYTPVTDENLAAKCICSDVKTIPGPIDPYANLVISETVTVNGEELPVTAISGKSNDSVYITVTVPKDVKYINEEAFCDNGNLDTIYLPEGCQMESNSVLLDTKIVYYKVNKDKNGNAVVETASTGEEITQVTVSGVDVLKPDRELNLNNIYGKYKITAVADDALDKSGKNLHTVILPNAVESINARVFENCKNLETIYLKEGCTIEDEEKIADKNLIYYTDDGDTISNAKINIDNFPLELSKINNRCNITTIGENAFKDQVKMKSVTIPATVKEIKANPFAGCTGLQTITVKNGNKAYKFENGVLLSESENKKTLVCYLAGNAGTTYTTPEGVTAIAAQAFADCKNLENVVLRENVTSVGADAFTGCDKLMAVYVWHLKSTSEEKDCDIDPTVLNSENIIYYIVADSNLSTNSNQKEVTIGKTTEDYNDSLAGGQNCIINRAGTELDLKELNKTNLYKITCIGATAFYQEESKQHNLKSIIIPEGVTTVNGGFLRYSQGLESVKLPTTLTSSLPKHSITHNKVLRTLTIPHRVADIDSDAFTATTGLETVYVRSGLNEKINYITGNSEKANIIYFNIPTTYGSQTREICIGKYSADSGNYDDLPGSCIINRDESTVDLRTIDENYKIKEIGTSAFSGANNLQEIIIPEGVTDIAKEAFRSCGKLESITLPTTLSKGLHHYFITDNNALKTLVVPHKIEAINSGAFASVTGLTRVFLKNGFDRGSIFDNSKSAKFIRYEVDDNNPREVKITDASEMSDVEKVVYCDEMGDRYVITGNESSNVTLKHRGDVEVPAKEATCTEKGNEMYWKCLCGANNYTGKDSETEAKDLTIAAAGHTNLSEVPAKAATFHARGVKAHYKCDECGELFSDGSATTVLEDKDVNIPKHEDHDFGAYSHDYGNQALHADICALKGTVAATCAICDQTDVKSCAEHTKSSHVWEEKITPATCTTAEKAQYICSLCNAEGGEKEIGRETGHDFESSTEYLHDSTQHWKKCKNCDAGEEIKKKGHDYDTVTNKCKVCDYEKTYTVTYTIERCGVTDDKEITGYLCKEDRFYSTNITDDQFRKGDTGLQENEIKKATINNNEVYFGEVTVGKYILVILGDETTRSTRVDVDVIDRDISGQAKLYLFGDVNEDNKADMEDVKMFMSVIVGNSEFDDKIKPALGYKVLGLPRAVDITDARRIMKV